MHRFMNWSGPGSEYAVISSLPMVLKRTLAHWKLLSAVVVGAVLAVTIMASSVIFFESLRDLALKRALEVPLPTALDVLVEAGDVPATRDTHRQLTSTIDQTIVSRLGPFLNRVDLSVKSWTFFSLESRMLPADQCACRSTAIVPTGPDGTPLVIECDCKRVAFYTIPDADRRVKLIEGRLPTAQTGLPEAGRGMVMEAMLDIETASRFNLTIGDTYPAIPYWKDEHDGAEAIVTGIYDRADPTEPVWRIFDDAFGTRGSSLEFIYFVVPEESILGGLSAYFPAMGADWVWLIDIDPESIHAADTGPIQAALRTTDNELSATVDGFIMESDLPATLSNFEEKLFFNRLPMFVVLILIVLVVLYYIVTLASLLVDAQKAEVGLLRSRGGTSLQILSVFVIEAVLLAAVGVIVGPLCALGAVTIIGILPPYHGLNDGALLPVQFTWNVMKLALIGGGLTLAALLIPAFRASRMGLLVEKRARARPARLAFVQRYYLDLVFLGLAVFLLWQLSKQGSFVGIQLFGDRTVSQLALATPAVLMVASGVILLRVFPLLMAALAKLVSVGLLGRLTPPSLTFGLWQMARNPSHHARLSLLLILTAGLGVFAASFARTLERGAQERALYDSGADLRATSVSLPPGGQSFSISKSVLAASGVTALSAVYRETGALTSAGDFVTFNVIGVDSTTIGEVAFLRDDFADAPVAELMTLISPADPGGIVLPPETNWISVLVKPLVRQPGTTIVVRLSDGNGRFYTLPLGNLTPLSTARNKFECAATDADEAPDWCRVGASIWPSQDTAPFQAPSPSLPLRIHSIGVTVPRGGSLAPGAIDIADISISSGDGEGTTVIEGFDSLRNWRRVFTGANSLGDSVSLAPEEPGTIRFRWMDGASRELRGLVYGGEEQAVPALVSPSFGTKYGVRKGETIDISLESVRMRILVKGFVSYFPTIDPNEGPFAILDSQTLRTRLNAERIFGDRQPTEFWIATTEGPVYSAAGAVVPQSDPSRLLVENSLGSARVRYAQVVDRAVLLSSADVDPLVALGWRALLGIAFFTVLVISAVGFLVHTRVSFDARRTEFALLRSIGLSMRQLLSLVILEQVLVIGVAIALGIIMGMRLGNTIMPYLANSGDGARFVPPMLVKIDWAGFATTFGLLGGVFVAVIAAILTSVYTMSIHRAMRMGEG